MRIIDYINQGGPIMYILLLLNIIGLAIILAKFFLLNKEQKNTEQTSNELAERIKKQNIETHDTNAIIELARQEVATYITQAEKGLNTVKIIASISPLLGLLGTVIGVLIAFRVMSESGLNNPSMFAKGISMALITTVGGLIVAIPHYIGHNYLIGLVDGIESHLEQKVLSKVL